MAKSMFAEFLTIQRIASGMSQLEVSEKLGYTTPQLVSNWENGRANPPIEALKTLGKHFGINEGEMLEQVIASTIEDVKTDLKRKFDESEGFPEARKPNKTNGRSQNLDQVI